MKKLEIIIESLESPKVMRILNENNVKGYTKLDNLVGRGRKEKISSYELTGFLKRTIFIVVDEEAVLRKVIEDIKPILLDYAGVMLVSDVEFIKSERY
jgi:nitrogen regulatory protein PII